MTVFERLAERGPHSADHLPGLADTLVIAFASIGHDPMRAPSPEFVASATAQGRPALFVSDAARSWTHAPGFADVLRQSVDRLRQRQPIRRIIVVGQSMGAFAALVATETLPVDVVLAFGPQSRLDDPDDHRWRDWIARITPLMRPEPPLGQAGWTVLMHGAQDDAAQALRFAPAAGIDQLIYPAQTHASLCPHLKAQGVLRGLFDAAATGDRRRLLRIAIGAGGQRRQLPR